MVWPFFPLGAFPDSGPGSEDWVWPMERALLGERKS